MIGIDTEYPIIYIIVVILPDLGKQPLLIEHFVGADPLCVSTIRSGCHLRVLLYKYRHTNCMRHLHRLSLKEIENYSCEIFHYEIDNGLRQIGVEVHMSDEICLWEVAYVY